MQERFINSITQDITYSQESGLAHSKLNKEIVARAWFAMNEMFLWTIVKMIKIRVRRDSTCIDGNVYSEGYINSTPSINKVCYFNIIKNILSGYGNAKGGFSDKEKYCSFKDSPSIDLNSPLVTSHSNTTTIYSTSSPFEYV